MALNVKYAKLLYDDMLNGVTKNPDEWIGFLNSASWMFEYTFGEQLLIYAQRADAKACATMEFWNKNFHRWIKKGSKAIRILKYENGNSYMQNIFDVSDTYQNYGTFKGLWNLNIANDEIDFIEQLESKYGELLDKTNIQSAISSAIENLVEDNINAYFDEDEYLEKAEDEYKEIFKELVRDSVIYMVNNRCGIPNDEYTFKLYFEKINYIADPEIITVFGNACRDLTREVLRETRTFVKNRSIEEKQRKVYLNDKNEKGGIDNARNENELYSGTRLYDSRIGSNEQANESEWEVRNSEGELSKEPQTEQVRYDDNAGNVNSSLESDSNRVRGTSGNNTKSISEEREDNRELERGKSNSVGTNDEQLESDGRGNSNARVSSQLNLFGNEYYDETEAYNDASVFSFPEEFIKDVLLEGSHFAEGKYRIYHKLLNSIDTQENIEFLKKEYGTGGRSSDKNGISEEHSSKGIELRDGYSEVANRQLLKWNEVEKRIKELVLIDNYFNDEEREKYKTWLIENGYETPKKVEKINFRITNDELGVGSLKDKYKRNIEAIKVLKTCEFENRLATKEEQEILSNYIGWGGLSKAFDSSSDDWKNEYEELKELLTNEEYNNARASTLTAFYTPPIVITEMYNALENMGFKTGNILEPSCGVGNFIGKIPDSMSDSKIYGVELDSLSGRIAKQLYQKADIKVDGFENVELPDNSFDIVIGNVPFGDFKVSDKRYDKNNFLIHDYFFAKALDKVRAGGVIAFITSKGTLDKENNSFRKYIAERADLIGAIRLPSNTFTKNAGTQVTSDIIFLQKRDTITYNEPEWIHLGKDENDITINQYFIDNPNMILGKMEMKSSQYGRMESTCTAFENEDLKTLLQRAILNIKAEIKDIEIDEINSNSIETSIPANLNVRNYSFTTVDRKIYYREDSKMYLQDLPDGTAKRIRKLIDIRDTTRKLIELQTYNASDEEIKDVQSSLNFFYDNFVVEFGRINERANKKAFEDDSSYYLISSLEILDDKGNFLRKADMFSKRTIKPHKAVDIVETSTDALIVSISEKAKVDLDYMSELCKQPKEKIIDELNGIIFKLPYLDEYVTADEYLSGNVRKKLEIANQAVQTDNTLEINIKYLKEAIPKDLQASEITAKLGATWIPPKYIEEFMYEILGTSWHLKQYINVTYSEHTGNWNISNKSMDSRNIKANTTWGTIRMPAYKILENTLNMKDVKVFDTVQDDEGKDKRVLNKKETAMASSKQDLIKEEFAEWIWKDANRREDLVRLYNDKFNSIRPREYDGEHIKFYGINPDIKLRKHQVNAIAHILYGGNTLLAHEVGAGKTFEMVAAAMESKRLGLSNKALFVVPNHIVEQFASEFLQLYPSANLLVATKKDFSTNYRKRFCSKIATGEYDAIIIGHSQFEKIPMSPERQKYLLEEQISEIVLGIEEAKRSNAERFTIKELERTKKHLEEKYKKLNDQSRKDNTIYFEELGIDKMFVDEAHNYKNLFLYTKMRNVSGIAQTEAQKSSDLFLKCRYLDEVTNGRGVVFATGTPVSNSMVELYTMQRYLQYQSLVENNLHHFDSWASTFGETINSLELSPEGTGYRAKTSFSKFNNLPELMSLFKEIADIQTSDTLNLPVPKANFNVITTEPSIYQEEMIKSLGERAEQVRNGTVDPSTDNMLKITNDGRKLALDQRLVNDMFEDSENSKINTCVNNIFKMYQEYNEDKMTQLVFCDLSTPKELLKSSEFFEIIEKDKNAEVPFIDVYTDLKCKLMKKGIPRNEIVFIHEADTENKKKELFAKVRNGNVRILIGSTSKMGAGTNVQTKLIALHDLDCPWRPADLTQRLGRIVRQGNTNKEVNIYRYVTKNTFDAYLFQLVEKKQKFIAQIMTSKTPVRSAEDVDEVALSYGEIKALASGNPLILEKTQLDADVAKLKLLKQSFLNNKYSLEDKILKYYPVEIEKINIALNLLAKDKIAYEESKQKYGDDFPSLTILGKTYSDKEFAAKTLLGEIKKTLSTEPVYLGEYRGFKLEVNFERFGNCYKMNIRNNYHYQIELGNDAYGNLTRIENAISNIERVIDKNTIELETLKQQMENAKLEVKAEFKFENELKEKQIKLNEINAELNINEKDNSAMIFDDNSEIDPKDKDDFTR